MKRDPSGASTEPPKEEGPEALEELRRLLAPPKEQLDTPDQRARELAQVLPKAIEKADAKDARSLTSALMPSLERGLERSIQKNPHVVVNAISPIIGPAIRRAISVALKGMVESLNQALEASFTARGLQWRLEALRTGRPFAEVALLHSLEFRVEQVFLIHRSTGLVLQHAAIPSAPAQDPDLVSAMLDALGSFARDSFQESQGQLEGFEYGELNVWIETQGEAVLAAAIRGTPPVELRNELRESLERICGMLPEALADFEGDAAPFALARPELEAHLVQKRKPQRSPWIAWFLLAGLLIFSVGALVYFWPRPPAGLKDCVARVRNTPGVELLSWSWSDQKLQIRGLKDPLSSDPFADMKDVRCPLSTAQMDVHWFSYQSPDLALARARQVLSPPSTLSLSLRDRTLTATGTADTRWLLGLDRLPLLIPGIEAVDRSNVKRTQPSGMKRALEAIQSQVVLFLAGSTQTLKSQKTQLIYERLATALRAADSAAATEGRKLQIELQGRADASGTASLNNTLSEGRAKAVLEELNARLITTPLRNTTLLPIGLGTKRPLEGHPEVSPDQLNRSVVLRVRP